MKNVSILLLLFTIFTAGAVNAQISFSKEYGGAYNEDGRWMEQMPDSGFILTGGTTTYSNGQTDIWLVRTDAYGNTLWQKSIGGVAFDFANMVKPVSGGLVICGVTNRNGSDDAIILKTDNSGNTIWTTIVGDTNIQWFEGFIPTSDGGYTAVGVNTGAGTHGTYDIFLVKFNGAGVKQWEKNIGGGSYEIGNSVQQTADGGYIISGQTYSYGNLDGDYYLVKTDASGNVVWEKTYGEPHLQECHYAQITPDGGYILVGDADTVPNSLGSTDIWLIKTDSLGNMLWDQVFGGSKKDGGKTVENTSDGGFIMAGITRSFGLINPNYYLVKTDANGILEWQKTSYGTAHHDHAYRGIETSDFGYAEFGFFRNSANFQNFALVKLPPNAGIVKDIAVDDIVAPQTTVCRSNNVGLGVLLTNYGATNEQNISVTLLIDNGTTTTALTDTFVGSLTPGNSTILNFTPTYDFNIDGVYSIKAFTQHRNSDISYTNDTSTISITVIPPTSDPLTTSSVSCNSGSMVLTATPAASTDSLFWYDAATNGNMVSAGGSYTTPSLSSTTTYYVQSEKGKGSKVGALDNSIGSGTTSSSGYLKFDSRVHFKLVSVLVYPSSSGNRTIELRNSGGTILQSKTINLPAAAGGIRVYLNFDVPEGNDLQLGLSSGSVNLFRNSSGATFPYSVSQTLEIYGTNSSNAGVYYYFYNWYVFVPSENCESNRIPVQGIIGSSSTTAFDVTRCGNGTVTLNANSPDALSWYSISSGGAPIGNGSSFTTPPLSSTTTYYLESASCSNRIAVDAIVNSVSTQPSSSNVNHCGPGTVNLSATAADPVYWYNAATNGTLMHSGSNFTTPYLNATTTYYAVAGSVCPSSPVSVSAIITGSNPPTVTGASACGPASVTLSASSPDPISWYTTPTGGSPVATTNTYATPVLASPTTYYAEAGTTCPSPRVPVVANVTITDPPVASPGSRCGNGTVVISAQSINAITWWSAPSGGSQLGSGPTYTTPSISTSTTYYAQATASGCNSVRTAVTASIIVTSPPSVTPGAHCGPGTVTLSAAASDSIFWYSAVTGGTLLGTGLTYTTPSISVTTTYYAQAGGNCPSTRIPVTANISSQATDPVTTGGSNCGQGTVSLSASSLYPITWYNAPGGSILGTGATFVTPSISATTTYYAVAGVVGCLSNPIAAVATINPLPANPATTGGSHCGAGQVSLTATSLDPITWYDAPGGNIVGTGNTFLTPAISTTTTYYAVAGVPGCVSNSTAATATINPLATSPVVTGSNNCGPGQLTLSATASNPMTWYSLPTGGAPLTTGPSYTATFNVTTIVYVESNNGTCPSARIPVTATIYTLPVVNLGPPVVNINTGQTIVLDAGAGYSNYAWSTSASTQTINVSTSGVYTVVVTDSHNCQGSDSITVNVLTGINDPSLESSLGIYPNPTLGMLNVTINNPAIHFNLQITDVEGRIIIEDSHKLSGLFNKTYNLSEFAKGIYFLRIISTDGSTTRRIVLQ